MAEHANSSTDSDKELIELGKKLKSLFETGYVDRKQALWWAFLLGVARGLGALVGSAIVVAVILWILSFFNQLPFAHAINQALQSALHKQ